MKIAILGRKKDTVNYERFLAAMPAIPFSTLEPDAVSSCDALLLPGGGDITPAFFGEHNNGSHHIDTELDILQLQALEQAVRKRLPVLGVCKGMQLINVGFLGTLTQHMSTAGLHCYQNGDQYHPTAILSGSCLYELYGSTAIVNSAHHQCVDRLGRDLRAIQWCETDGCIEAIVHEYLPVLGLQWHPERIDTAQTTLDPSALLRLLYAWICAARGRRRD